MKNKQVCRICPACGSSDTTVQNIWKTGKFENFSFSVACVNEGL